MKKSTQKIIYTVLIMAVLAVIAVYAYFQTTRNPEEKAVPKTKLEKLISRNLEGNYPATPREVVKTYGELTKYLYNGDEEGKMTDRQFEALFDQVRLLYDEELLAQNPREEQLARLKYDVADYRKADRDIMSCSVQKTSQIEHGKLNGADVVKVALVFMTKATGEQPAKTYEQFLLREDENKNWKILGWQQVSGAGIEEE